MLNAGCVQEHREREREMKGGRDAAVQQGQF